MTKALYRMIAGSDKQANTCSRSIHRNRMPSSSMRRS
jgi:hypothetical protein